MAKEPILGSKPEKPFDGVETVEEHDRNERIATAAQAFLAATGKRIQNLLPNLKRAATDIKKGALPKTALFKRTGIRIDDWRELYPRIVDEMECIHADAQVNAEQRTFSRKPDYWLRFADPDTWTPKEKQEHSGDLTINVQFGDDQPARPPHGTGDSGLPGEEV